MKTEEAAGKRLQHGKNHWYARKQHAKQQINQHTHPSNLFYLIKFEINVGVKRDAFYSHIRKSN